MIEVIGTVYSTYNKEFRDKLSECIKEIQDKYKDKDSIDIDIQYSTCRNAYGNVEYSALIIGRK